jgi:signal transduction histidine kinase
VRDFARRHGVPIALRTEGDFDRLSERQRTCVYRVVQEALTNCVRHARADHIEVAVSAGPRELVVVVRDDGIGIDAGRRDGGLGLRGIEERVRELQGRTQIRSEAGAGTTVTIRLPLTAAGPEVAHARAAG